MKRARVLRRVYATGLALVLGAPVAAGAEAVAVHDAAGMPADTRQAKNDEVRRVIDLNRVPPLADILPTLARKRIVFVGETHTRLDHHLTQLEIIKGIKRRGRDLAIGAEFLQQRFQDVVDAYINGEIDERAFLQRTGYYEHWKYDYRLYAPILRFARDERIPVIALNLPAEITRAVSSGGMESLSEEQRKLLPKDMGGADAAYRERLRAVFDQHPETESRNFDYFVQAQLVWDEAMADRAARYLREHPRRMMVVLAGAGHLVSGSGIPRRVQRRISVDRAIVLQDASVLSEPRVADYLVLSPYKSLPPAGMLGIYYEDKDATVKVTKVVDDSAAAAAGIRAGDSLVALDGVGIGSESDVRLAMWDKKPGDRVSVTLRRQRVLRKDAELTVDAVLR